MTLEEAHERLAVLHPPPKVAELLEDFDEEEEPYLFDEDDTAEAIELLRGAASLLGFFGDRHLSKTIVAHDRKRMTALAEEIQIFLTALDSDEFTTE